ncbi:MAG: signal peptidase I [Culicoidibacterales bacterium]
MKSAFKTILQYAGALLLIFVLATFLRTNVFTVINVSGDSMVPTLHDNNMMILNRVSYKIHDIERFDIVVVDTNDEFFIIKRVIGLPGDHVQYENGQLYINEEPLDEAYIVDPAAQYTYDFDLVDLPGGYTTIPEGNYLVLGDNRLISKDSRAIGLVESEQIIGKTNWVVWPPQEIKVAE